MPNPITSAAAAELDRLSEEAKGYVTALEQQAKSLWARWEVYLIAGAALVSGFILGHVF